MRVRTHGGRSSSGSSPMMVSLEDTMRDRAPMGSRGSTSVRYLRGAWGREGGCPVVHGSPDADRDGAQAGRQT